MQQMRNFKLLMLGVIFCYSGYAQDPRLYDNNWYFASGELNGVELEKPFPLFNSLLEFNSTPPFETFFIHDVTCEETNSSNIVYDPIENIFNLQGGWGGLVGTCFYEFMRNHQSVYYDSVNNTHKNPFNYLIVDDGSNLQLTVFNGNGDRVIYNSIFLTKQDFNVLTLSIYPNPVQDELFFSVMSDRNFFNALIFDLHGRMVLSINDFDEKSINLQELKSGVYFMRLNDKLGRSVIKKFIKN
jgi:hypothetical protein